MTSFLSSFRDRLHALAQRRATLPRIYLPEAGHDERMLLAAVQIVEKRLARPVLVGTRAEIERLAGELGISLAPFEIDDPATSPHDLAVVERYAQKIQERNLPIDDPRLALRDPLTYSALMVELGLADGMVAGAYNTTSAVLRAAIRCVGMAPESRTVTSYFLMVLPEESTAGHTLLVYADCAVVIEPTAEQLADIAMTVADEAREFLSSEPRMAMLSFSTRGSAQHASVERVREATRIVREKRPDLIVDGELQADAALIESVYLRKAPDSPLHGKANVLIFPDLDSGNIVYKLTQRLCGAAAIGPVMCGLAKPINDLSRGCSVDDIVDIVAVTSARVK